MDTAPTCRLLRSSDKKVTGERVFRYESRSFLNWEGITPVKLVRIRGAMLISLSMSTCNQGVNKRQIFLGSFVRLRVQTRLKKPSFCTLSNQNVKRCVFVCMSTLRLGVNGSGSLMLRGKALRMRLRSWMQLGGITSQKP